MNESASIKWFSDVGLGDRPQVGGKGASLGELTRAGIPVPPGFVIPVSAFEAFLAATGHGDTWRRTVTGLDPGDLNALKAASDGIRAQITAAPLPPGLEKAITDAYLAIAGADTGLPVAVRSSATSEDSEEASFAGLQDTYLWVRGAQSVLDNVRRCWASLYNPESIAYRLRLKLPEAEVAMAVVVQRMVCSKCAGVMFTRSPTTGDRSTIVIEASWGFGSALVSGEVTPDRYVASKVTGDVSKRTVSQKLLRHVPDAASRGVLTEPVPEDLQSVSCLSNAELAELVKVARRIEQHYGCPQDIEWAMEDGEDGHRIFIVQSRPETVWATRERQPISQAKDQAFEHVFAAFSQRKQDA